MEPPGTLEFFDLAKPEDWEAYEQRFGFYVAARGIADPVTKKAVFLSSCGPAAFNLARAVVAPATLAETTLEDILRLLRLHLSPKASILTWRMDFLRRVQLQGESVSSFIAALRGMARHCEFSVLAERLLDQFVLGLRSAKARRRICTQRTVTLEEAFEVAAAEELAFQDKDSLNKPVKGKSVTVSQTLPQTNWEESPEREVYRTAAQQAGAPGRPFQSTCAGCGEQHNRRDCRFKDVICRSCGRKGHLAKVCRAKDASRTNRRSPVKFFSSRDNKPRQEASKHIDCNSSTILEGRVTRFPALDKVVVTVKIEGHSCQMEVDSGASFTLVTMETAKAIFANRQFPVLEPFPLRMRSYTAGNIDIAGMCTVNVQFGTHKAELKMVIVKGPRTNLLGLDWFPALGVQLIGVKAISNIGCDLGGLVKEFPEVFDGKLGCYKGPPISFALNPQVNPIRVRARRVPFALKAKIDKEIDKLIEQGVLEQVENAVWETPIVTPMKANGEVRICADYKCTINKALQPHSYPIPVVAHLLANLAGGTIFTKIDLAQAYQQLPVTKEAADAQTIVTHRGAFRVKRLQFGVNVAPGVFQGLMENTLRGLPGVLPFFDDVLIAGSTPEDLLEKTRGVLKKLQDVGLKLKPSKCHFGVSRVEFLGFSIDASGIHPTADKTKAITEAPRPTNKQELQAFLGLVNFYHSFLPNKATVAEPLHRLLQKNSFWVWGKPQQKAFDTLKQLLINNNVLAHYDESKPLRLSCDASPYGVGAVLSHVDPSGQERPIAFYSRSLTKPEKNYAQIDKEALAIVAGVKKYNDYLYGRPFTIQTDHKPLLGLFVPAKQTPQMLSPRMLRWSIFLNAYQYSLEYVQGKKLGHADALSRLPLPGDAPVDPAPAECVMMLEDLPGPPVTAADIAAHSGKDPVLSRVLQWVGRGWPPRPEDSRFQPYSTRKDELSTYQGCLLWGNRVVVPGKLRGKLLSTLHAGHPGMVRMKALARSYVWWPKMDQDIEEWVSGCKTCQESRPEVPKAEVHWWEKPKGPWVRLHIDFAGPFQGQTFLIVVDAFSKWVEVLRVKHMTSQVVIAELRRLFATHGIPEVIVSDNGTAFVSGEFRAFLDDNLIRQANSAPFHPSSNGQAERMVRSMKEVLKRMPEGDWQTKLARLMLHQHATPCMATGKSPAELLLGRRLVTALDFVHPDRAPPQAWRGAQHKDVPKTRQFAQGDLVWAKNYAKGAPWVPATVTRVLGPCTYFVILEDGRPWKRHVDQLRWRSAKVADSQDMEGLGASLDKHCDLQEPTAPPLEGRPAEGASDSQRELTAPPSIVVEREHLDHRSVPILAGPGEPQCREATNPGLSPGSNMPLSPEPATPGRSPSQLSGPRRSARARHPPRHLKDYVCHSS